MFTFLIWATERDDKFDPPGVRDTALDRMRLVQTFPEMARKDDL